MEYLIGLILALAVCIFALLTGFDRGRVFYSTVVIVVAHYYILFAAMGASSSILIAESAGATAFIVLAVIGFKKSSLDHRCRARRPRHLRLLPSPAHSRSRRPHLVARLLHVLRRRRRSLPRHSPLASVPRKHHGWRPRSARMRAGSTPIVGSLEPNEGTTSSASTAPSPTIPPSTRGSNNTPAHSEQSPNTGSR